MTRFNVTRQQSLYRASSDRALQARRRDLAQIQEQLSTGKRINRASDDPAGYARARRLATLSDRYAQYERSAGEAQSWMDHTQDALDTIADRFLHAHELAVQGANDASTDDARETLATSLEAMIDEVADLLNARDGDEYVFAGTNTTVRPFEVGAGGVTYTGNGNGRTREVGDGLRLAVNISGEQVMNTGAGFTVFESLQGMADALRSGDPAQMDAALGDLTTARDHVIDTGGEAGGIAERINQAAGQLRQAQLRVESRRSEVEDTDMAAAVMAFQQQQTGLQAALKVTASVMQTSLLDYLR